MAYHSLAEFLEELGQAGELVRVEAEVDPVLEAAEIADRVARGGGPAVLFGAVRGRPLPVVTGLLATDGRICRALASRSPQEIALEIAELVKPSQPEGWLDRIKAAPGRAALRASAPKTVRNGACQQVVRLGEDVDLGELPALVCRPEESGPTITAAQVFAADAESGQAVIGHYDVRVLDHDRLAVCWSPHDEPAALVPGYRQRGDRMPLAVVLGGDPAGLLAAIAPLPSGADVSALAGLLRNKPRELVRCRSIELEVPTDAEMVIEGFVDPGEPPRQVGLLGTSGGYRFCPPAPAMHVTAVTHRANPIVPAMVPGGLADEACGVRRALARILLPIIQLAVPELVDLDLPAFGAARHWALASVRKTYAGQPRRVAHALWGLRQMMFSKLLVIVDRDVDVGDHPAVWAAVASHVDPAADVFFAAGPPDPTDPAAAPGELTRRMAIDATAKLPGETRGVRPPRGGRSKEIQRLVTDRWNEYRLGPEASE
jgi:4-hydroxy-3-polyprenylbenzoate decarboxylase